MSSAPVPSKLDLSRLFNPRSIAIVGASDDTKTIGGQPVKFLTEFGYQGRVFPVNPKRDTIRGLTCYPSVTDLPEAVDVALVAVGAKYVPGVIEECGKKGIPFAVVMSAGFREVGGEGVQLEKDLEAAIAKSGVRMIGPNGMGLLSLKSSVYMGFGNGFQYNNRPVGPVALVTQSGGFGFTMVSGAEQVGLGFSYIVSAGNSTDLNTLDLIEYWLGCDDVKVIAAFIEGVADGRRLIELGQRALEAGKPIIVWKAGNSKSGSKAAASHTASLAASYDLYKAAFRSGGYIEVKDYDDLVDIARAFIAGKLPPGKRLGVISGSGGAGVVVADRAEEYGLELPELAPESLAKLDGFLPAFASKANPLDISGAPSKDGKSASNRALQILLEDPNLDQVILRSKQSTNTPKDAADFIKLVKETDKAVYVAMQADPDEDVMALFQKHDISFHITPPRAAYAAAAISDFAERRRRYLAAKKDEARPVAAQKLDLPAGEATLSEYAAKAVLKAYGIPVVGEALMSLDEVKALKAAPFPFPLAVKINSADIPHKTEAGGVKLGINSVEELKAAAEAVTANAKQYKPGAKLEGVLVQQMASGLEVIVGGLNDPCFGPTVVFGLGGIFAEVLRDVTYRFAPFGIEAAREMIDEIKGVVVMKGYRGREALDTEGLAQVLSRVSWLLHDHSDRIAEMDINPLFMTPGSITAADGLITLKA
jgi:acyl-CoA synthetase (NDP forming)